MKRRTEALLARFGALVCRAVPYRAVPVFGRLLGRLGWIAARSSRRIALSQLEAVFDESRASWRKSICVELYMHLGTNLIETVKLPHMSRDERLQRITVEGLDIFRDAFDRGRGLLAVTGHIGNWEVLAAAFCDLGFPINVVGRRNPNPWLDTMIQELRAGYGATVLDRDRDARRMLKCLRRGEVVALLVDQDTKVDGIFLPFLGREAYTPVGHARLSARTGAPVVIITINRVQGGRGHHIKVWEEILPPEGEDEVNVVRMICSRCNSVLDEAIRAAPSQWVWFHRRWRTKQKKSKSDVLHGV